MKSNRTGLALQCLNVDKVYVVEKKLRVWRIFLGVEIRGRKIKALDKVTMDVPLGKIVGILGKNGAGKSTLLRVLGGVYQPTAGLVEMNGQVAGLFELGGIGNPNLTGREYATRYLRIMGTKSNELHGFLDEIQDFSELGTAFDQPVRTYSSGMGARLYFASATAAQHEIYLIDELLSVGDEHFQAKCWRRMRQRLLTGASGVLVTHDWMAVLRLCEVAHVIERGRLVFSGSSDKAAVLYLDLPKPEASLARFSPENPQDYVLDSENDSQIRLLVDIFEPIPVEFAISIEILRIGIGWEILLLVNSIPVADQPGHYHLDINIPNLPLVPGNYSLNVFLSRGKELQGEATVSLDSRTWTRGNGFNLKVLGDESSASVKLPFRVRKLDVSG